MKSYLICAGDKVFSIEGVIESTDDGEYLTLEAKVGDGSSTSEIIVNKRLVSVISSVDAKSEAGGVVGENIVPFRQQ